MVQGRIEKAMQSVNTCIQSVVFGVVLFFLFAAACSKGDGNLAQIKVDFKWNPPCQSPTKSPEITVSEVPVGTVRLYVKLTDLMLPGFDHGGGFVSYKGQSVIKAGGIGGSYHGPTPIHGATHQMEIRVEALDGDDRIIGVGRKSRPFPPEGEPERWDCT